MISWRKPKHSFFGACKLWLIPFGILLFPTELFRWAGLQLKDTVFKCKERFFCVLKLHKFLFRAHLPDLLWAENTLIEKLSIFISKRKGLVLCLIIFCLHPNSGFFFQALHRSLYKLEVLLAHHFQMHLYFKPMTSCNS